MMENEPPNTEASDDQGPNQVRSYECTFCKRGFSNAQALGGHMNMHRKDKAKLKQASSSTHNTKSSILEIPKTAPSLYSPIPTNIVHQPQTRSSTIEDFEKLPLFAETPSSTTAQKPGSRVDADDEKAGLELDLELRLGPEPQDSSTVTKKFL